MRGAKGKPRDYRIDHAGERYGRLLVVGFHHRGNRRESYWLCRCDCGHEHIAAWGNLRSGCVKSCGCLHDEVAGDARRTHGRSKTRTYRVWVAMIKRCENTRGEKWHRYGGRGITVCKRWRESFEAFFADMGEAPAGLSIDRRDNDGNYEKDNCRWATAIEQANNKGSRPSVEQQAEGANA